jgi:hypothetical protein
LLLDAIFPYFPNSLLYFQEITGGFHRSARKSGYKIQPLRKKFGPFWLNYIF